MEKRNIAIIAHVDHGKTTLVDQLLKQSGVFRDNETICERVMDSNDLERERGITIVSKNCSIVFDSVHINIVDTPGHADFGGEVERILSMVDGVLLLVDAVEGPMPQTRFVTNKALQIGLKPIVVINKIDKVGARPDWVIDETFELFANLGANDQQLDFPVIYASAIKGFATVDPLVQQKDMKELLSIIVTKTPKPSGDVAGPFRMQISAVDYSPYLGKIGIGKISRGVLALRDNLVSLEGEHGPREQLTISSIQIFKGLDRVNVDKAEAGQIVIINGIDDIKIGATLCDSSSPEPFPILQVDEPTLGVNFFVNSSPFAGREGKFVTGRQIRERLEKELITNLALKVNFNDDQEIFEVFGRGELHLTILIENLRREGFELSVSKPTVVYKTGSDGKRLEPYETLIMEVGLDFQGMVMKSVGERGAKLCNMENINEQRVRLEYFVSTKALIGFHSEFTTITKGTGIFSHSFAKYDSVSSISSQRKNGALVSQENGTINAYALWKIQERGRLFVSPGVEVYEGMIIGVHARPNDLIVNPIKGKKLTNIRASGKDEHIELKNMMELNLEKGLGILGDDELLEITPKALRLRKLSLTEGERRRNSRQVTAD
ncbi:translational GTPase TypA [Betaproteobacteria bacterium]|nr:translational GTPase TypA [Betaproteobacteria bacterium]